MLSYQSVERRLCARVSWVHGILSVEVSASRSWVLPKDAARSARDPLNPNYASAIVTTDQIVDLISTLS